MVSKISILLVGSNPFPILPQLLDYKEENKYNLICFNLLDYKLPSESDKIKSRWYRTELQRAFRLLKDADTSMPEVQLELLRDNDKLGLDDVDLELNSWLSGVFDQKATSVESYKFISSHLSKSNVDLYPLVSDPLSLYVSKGPKYAPLRYFHQTGELIRTETKPDFLVDTPDELAFWHSEELEKVELEENTVKNIKDSNLFLILVSDLVSLAILSKSEKIIDQLNTIKVPYIMIWPPEYTSFSSFVEEEVFKHLSFGSSIDKLIDTLAPSVNYLLTGNDIEEFDSIVTKTGYKSYDEIDDIENSKNMEFMEFLNEIQTMSK